MRILEIKEKISGTKIPKNIFKKIKTYVSNSLKNSSDDYKQLLADQLNRAILRSNRYVVPLTPESKQYLVFQIIPELIKVTDHSVSKMLTKLQARLQPKIESLKEGYDVRISHPEDLVWQSGGSGAKEAVEGLSQIADDAANISIKWDGSPALIFGRNEEGDIIVTDKSGFLAKTYDGMNKSSDDIINMFVSRNSDQTGREEFAFAMGRLWELLERIVPSNFEGYIQGDVLYYEKPEIVDGAYQFKRNKIQYRIPVDSELGEKIGVSEAGIVIHSYIPDRNSGMVPFTDISMLHSIPELAIITPELNHKPNISSITKPNINYELINDVINPIELRNNKITDFGKLVGRYICYLARSGVDNYSYAGDGFMAWLETAGLTDNKLTNIKNWISTNQKAYSEMWYAIEKIHDYKMKIKSEIDSIDTGIQASLDDVSGHEGYVVVTPLGTLKLVVRHEFMREHT